MLSKFEVEWTLNGQPLEVEACSHDDAKRVARAQLEHLLDDVAGTITVESVAEVVEAGPPLAASKVSEL